MRLTSTLGRSISALALAFGASTLAQAADPILHTDQGQARGIASNGVSRFLGLPFAAPPVGDLRWKAPQAPAAWPGVRDATQFANVCPQEPSAFSGRSETEDCLYLNVYRPDNSNGQALPVMVWIHGGGYVLGAGSYYDGAPLARQAKAVVVTVNYRLGVFGFMALPGLQAESAAANYGIQDQQAALRWVKQHASRLGGDPNRVTVFGQSAGGNSACVHVVSPGSAGLFNGAISESGPCVLLRNVPLAQIRDQSEVLAQSLGCPGDANQVACMRQKSTVALMNATPPDLDIIYNKPAWVPAIDGVVLPDAADKLIQSGRINKVPVMFGGNHDEGRLFVALTFHLGQQRGVTAADHSLAMRGMVGPALAPLFTDVLYSAARYGSLDKALAAAVTDNFYACSSLGDVKSLSSFTKTFAFEFNDPNAPGAAPDPYFAWNAYHSAELAYIFQGETPSPLFTPAQQTLADQMVKYWANFAAKGDPNGSGLPHWSRFNKLGTPVQNLAPGAVTTMGLGQFERDHQCGVWATVHALRRLNAL
ncbi:carboxylesterase/lipase family protein [Aquabacterium sp. CECT 9606]|uniref:carboxylesterase/lipase family protein n=1 Tax=Aquabacterium sp. CECT 9606 TaxID=2845822 RepID=UPI001E43C4BD|nr:carboxylesterase/lipase family protein [Aquabacterium sp. CECT 9606]CAH0349266.1 Para-nitrobenzyl esterase [Aquabacterium sp. CECT 9606]